MKILDYETIENYDFKLTKNNVDHFMREFLENYYKYKNLLPPNMLNRFKEVSVANPVRNTSNIENYVIKKINLEEKIKNDFSLFLSLIECLNDEEINYIKHYYFQGISDEKTNEIMNVGKTRYIHIKKSAILKIALAEQLAVERRNKKMT